MPTHCAKWKQSKRKHSYATLFTFSKSGIFEILLEVSWLKSDVTRFFQNIWFHVWWKIGLVHAMKVQLHVELFFFCSWNSNSKEAFIRMLAFCNCIMTLYCKTWHKNRKYEWNPVFVRFLPSQDVSFSSLFVVCMFTPKAIHLTATWM